MEQINEAFNVSKQFLFQEYCVEDFFFYIKDLFTEFLLTDRNFRYFGFTLLLIQWISYDQTLNNFRKLFIKDIGCKQ